MTEIGQIVSASLVFPLPLSLDLLLTQPMAEPQYRNATLVPIQISQTLKKTENIFSMNETLN